MLQPSCMQALVGSVKQVPLPGTCGSIYKLFRDTGRGAPACQQAMPLSSSDLKAQACSQRVSPASRFAAPGRAGRSGVAQELCLHETSSCPPVRLCMWPAGRRPTQQWSPPAHGTLPLRTLFSGATVWPTMMPPMPACPHQTLCEWGSTRALSALLLGIFGAC